MRFAIGLENINYSLPQIEDKVVTSESNVVDDNLTELQLQDHSQAFESLNNEVDLMLKGYDVCGFEADDSAKKKNIFARIWDAIVKMFKTLGKYIRDGFKWVAKKFGFGGNSNINTINTDVAQAAAEAGSIIASELKANDKKSNVESNTTIKEDEVVVEKATIEKIIKDSINKAFSKKTSIKNAKLLKHNLQEQYEKTIIYSDSKELAVVDKSNNSPLDVMLINIARFAKRTVEIPFMFFEEDVLKRFEKEFEVYKGRFTERDRHVISTVKELAKDGDKIYNNDDNTKIHTLANLSTFSDYIIDCIYVNSIMLNTLTDAGIDTKILDSVAPSGNNRYTANKDNFSKAKEVVSDALNKFREASKSPLTLNLKYVSYTLELHNIMMDGKANNATDKEVINRITNDPKYKLNEELYKLLDKCIKDYIDGFAIIDNVLNDPEITKRILRVDEATDSNNNIRNKRTLAFLKSMLVESKEIAKLSLKVLSNTNKLVENSMKKFGKMGTEKFMANKYGE